MTPKPGAYRALFTEGLEALEADLLLHIENARDTAEMRQKLSDIRHYLRLLDDPSYKFGKLTQGGGSTDFFRS